MINLFDRFTSERRYFVVGEKHLIEVMKMIQTAWTTGSYTGGMTVGNCGWADEPISWYIHVNLTKKEWCALLKECESRKFQLVIKDVPNRMYFTKVKES